MKFSALSSQEACREWRDEVIIMARKPAPIKIIKSIWPEDGRVGPGWVYVTQLLFIAAERAEAAKKTKGKDPVPEVKTKGEEPLAGG